MTLGNSVSAKRVAAYLVGLGFFFAMLRPPFFGSLVTNAIPEPENLRMVYDVTTIFIGLILVVGGSRQSDSRFKFGSLAVIVVFVAAGILGMEIINAGRFVGVDAFWLYVVGVPLLCLGLSSLAAGWIYLLARFSVKNIPLLALVAFASSHVCCVLDLLPREVSAMMPMGYPVLSPSMLFVCLDDAKTRLGIDCKKRTGSDDCQDGERRARLLVLVLMSVLILCGALLRSRCAHGGVNYSTSYSTVHTYLISLATGLLLAYVIVKARSAAEGSLVIGGIGFVGFVLAAVSYVALPPRLLSPFVTALYSALMIYALRSWLSRRGEGKHKRLSLQAPFCFSTDLYQGSPRPLFPPIFCNKGRRLKTLSPPSASS